MFRLVRFESLTENATSYTARYYVVFVLDVTSVHTFTLVKCKDTFIVLSQVNCFFTLVSTRARESYLVLSCTYI